jgi:hypothetical protein
MDDYRQDYHNIERNAIKQFVIGIIIAIVMIGGIIFLSKYF